MPSAPFSPAVPPYSAYLRVFEPLDAFDEPERRRWEAYVDAGADRRGAHQREHVAGLRRLLSTPPAPVPAMESAEALVHRAGGTVLVCPLQTRLRSWHALDGLVQTLNAVALDAVVPAAQLAREAVARERWLKGTTDVRVRIRTATWEVPLSWFVLVEAAERVRSERSHGSEQSGSEQSGSERSAAPERGEEREHVEECERQRGTGAIGAAPSLRYVAPMASARTRAARALRTLRASLGEQVAITGEVEEVARWLELFHPHALVELDYGGVAGLLGNVGLASDDSLSDVQLGLASLAAGDATGAAAAHRRLSRRWGRVRALARAS